MKTRQVKNGWRILFTVCVLFSVQQAFAQSCPPERMMLEDEYKLNLEKHLIDSDGVNSHKVLFENNFKNDRTDRRFDMVPDTITIQAILELYCKAWNVAKNDPSYKENKTATALRITLGVEGNDVVYFYQPVYLRYQGIGDHDDERRFKVINYDSLKFYKCKKGRIEVASNVNQQCKEYEENVKIKGLFGYRHARCENDGSWKEDTKSILFTFREFFLLYHEVYKDEPYTKSFTINSGAAKFTRKDWYINIGSRTKHTIYIEPAEPNKFGIIGNKFLSTITAKGANFAHLCPPSCGDVTFVNQK